MEDKKGLPKDFLTRYDKGYIEELAQKKLKQK